VRGCWDHRRRSGAQTLLGCCNPLPKLRKGGLSSRIRRHSERWAPLRVHGQVSETVMFKVVRLGAGVNAPVRQGRRVLGAAPQKTKSARTIQSPRAAGAGSLVDRPSHLLSLAGSARMVQVFLLRSSSAPLLASPSRWPPPNFRRFVLRQSGASVHPRFAEADVYGEIKVVSWKHRRSLRGSSAGSRHRVRRQRSSQSTASLAPPSRRRWPLGKRRCLRNPATLTAISPANPFFAIAEI